MTKKAVLYSGLQRFLVFSAAKRQPDTSRARQDGAT